MKHKFNSNIITTYMQENNLSKNAFCKLCQISPSTLNKMLVGNLNFGSLALYKVATTINVRMQLFFE